MTFIRWFLVTTVTLALCLYVILDNVHSFDLTMPTDYQRMMADYQQQLSEEWTPKRAEIVKRCWKNKYWCEIENRNAGGFYR